MREVEIHYFQFTDPINADKVTKQFSFSYTRKVRNRVVITKPDGSEEVQYDETSYRPITIDAPDWAGKVELTKEQYDALEVIGESPQAEMVRIRSEKALSSALANTREE